MDQQDAEKVRQLGNAERLAMNYEQGNDCHFCVLRSSFKVQLFARCGLIGNHRESPIRRAPPGAKIVFS
jgi:hypothetical protein